MNPVINKFLVALVGALVQLQINLADGMTPTDWIEVAIAALTAIGVYAVPNALKGRGGADSATVVVQRVLADPPEPAPAPSPGAVGGAATSYRYGRRGGG